MPLAELTAISAQTTFQALNHVRHFMNFRVSQTGLFRSQLRSEKLDEHP